MSKHKRTEKTERQRYQRRIAQERQQREELRRHTAATRLALSGKVQALELCAIMGWKNPRQAMVYFNPTASQLAARLG